MYKFPLLILGLFALSACSSNNTEAEETSAVDSSAVDSPTTVVQEKPIEKLDPMVYTLYEHKEKGQVQQHIIGEDSLSGAIEQYWFRHKSWKLWKPSTVEPKGKRYIHYPLESWRLGGLVFRKEKEGLRFQNPLTDEWGDWTAQKVAERISPPADRIVDTWRYFHLDEDGETHWYYVHRANATADWQGISYKTASGSVRPVMRDLKEEGEVVTGKFYYDDLKEARFRLNAKRLEVTYPGEAEPKIFLYKPFLEEHH